MANYLTFRLDASVDGATREAVVEFLNKRTESHCVCYEISDVTKKPHYQGWMYTNLSKQTMSNYIKKRWPGATGTRRGRSSGKYSCVPVKKETYVGYTLKGTPTELPDIVSGQLPIGYDLEAEHRKWWSNQASTVPASVHVVEEGIDVFTGYDWGDANVIDKRTIVVGWLCTKYSRRGQNSFLFKNYVNGILNETCPEHKAEFIRQVAQSERW